jgi:hypothetical protein
VDLADAFLKHRAVAALAPKGDVLPAFAVGLAPAPDLLDAFGERTSARLDGLCVYTGDRECGDRENDGSRRGGVTSSHITPPKGIILRRKLVYFDAERLA